MGEILEVTKTLVEPAMKLMDAVQSAIGKAYDPMHVRRMADAKAHEIEKISSAMREANDIPIIYNNGDISLDTTEFDEFVKRTQNRLVYQELQKQHNIERVVDLAYEMLEQEEQVSNEPVNLDWINRLFNYVGDISDEKMQALWSAILAGEIKKTSSFSLRTLETLYNISQQEAEIFQKISKYFVYYKNIIYLPRYEALLKEYNISYSDILKLDECGLINSSAFISLNIIIGNESNIIARNDSYLVTAHSKNTDNVELKIDQYPLTSVGMEIFRIFNSYFDDDFFIKFSYELKKYNYNKADICLYEIIEEQKDGIITHSDIDLLAEKDV